jgi:hypothetical protein
MILRLELATALAVTLATACGGMTDRGEAEQEQKVPALAGVQAMKLGVLQVLVPVEGVPLRTLSYRVNAVSDGSLIQEGEAQVSTTTSHHPSGSTRTDLTFAISLPPSQHNLLNWNGQVDGVSCDGALGPFDIEELRTVTFISPGNCEP